MIRQAQHSDFSAISRIKSEVRLDVTRLDETDYRIHSERTGFLLPSPFTAKTFSKDIRQQYFVYHVAKKVVGFLRMTDEHEVEESGERYWLEPELRSVYFSTPHFEISGIAVLPEFGKTGIATKLLLEALRVCKNQQVSQLFSLVVLSPVTNIPSILFHEKHGFRRIAVSTARKTYDLNGYQSILYAKKIE